MTYEKIKSLTTLDSRQKHAGMTEDFGDCNGFTGD